MVSVVDYAIYRYDAREDEEKPTQVSAAARLNSMPNLPDEKSESNHCLAHITCANTSPGCIPCGDSCEC
jgi:hypothetical protein